jgi:hypothetical protein
MPKNISILQIRIRNTGRMYKFFSQDEAMAYYFVPYIMYLSSEWVSDLQIRKW